MLWLVEELLLLLLLFLDAILSSGGVKATGPREVNVTFKFITFPSHVAYIVLEPFCTSLNEDHILNLLNEVTIWVRYFSITWSVEPNKLSSIIQKYLKQLLIYV